MIAFQVYLNGKKVCTAGVGDDGVLSANVTWARRIGDRTRSKTPESVEEELAVSVGGLISPKDEHVRWHEPLPVKIGDEVRVEIVELSKVDDPPIRAKKDPAKDERRRKSYVKEMAKQLGWKLIIPEEMP